SRPGRLAGVRPRRGLLCAGRAGSERPQFQALDPTRIGVEDFELEIARTLEDLAAAGKPAYEGGDETADRIHLLVLAEGGEIEADSLRDLLKRRARFDDEGAVARWLDRRLGLVVLVLDVADDRFDQVLDRDEAIGAAVFVDHQRHMG